MKWAPKPGKREHGADKSNFRQKKVLVDRIVGATFRSATGCSACRKRKRKCDEHHPVCHACTKRGTVCVWREVKKTQLNNVTSEERRTAKTIAEAPGPPTVETGLCGVETNLVDSEILRVDAVLDGVPDLDAAPAIGSGAESGAEIARIGPHAEVEAEIGHAWPKPAPVALCALPAVLPLFLSHSAAERMHHFGQRVSNTLAVGTHTSNYFCKTFLALAYVDEAIGHAIASWGAFYRHEPEAQARHMGRAVALRTRGAAPRSRFDLFCGLCFQLVVLGQHVCRGDVERWWQCFRACVRLVAAAGGPDAVCRLFGRSNDVKFVVSNIFYHDVLSSDAFAFGPAIPMQRWAEVFDGDFFSPEYGIDPLQGCLNPVYMLLGEALEMRCAMAKRRARLHQMLEGELGAETNTAVLRDFDRVRTDYLQSCCAAADALQRKLDACAPDESVFARAALSPDDAALHRRAFELHRLALQLHCAMAIRGLHASAAEVELMQTQLRAEIDGLVDSRMVLVLCFPLLVAGVACHTKRDRRTMAATFHATIARCPVGNVGRAWEVVQETWRRSGDGRMVDWAEVCVDLGWHLCVC